MTLSIECESCFEKDSESIYYAFYEQNDDLVTYICPKCKTKITYDSVEVEKINIINWIYENNIEIYKKIIKSYYNSKLEPLNADVEF